MKTWECSSETSDMYCVEDDTYVGLVSGLLEIAVTVDKDDKAMMRICDFGTYADDMMYATVIVSRVI